LATAALSIKLRCGSWQQLATIYRRDLSRGTMFLKASQQPPIGMQVRIDLELPSATVIELSGTIAKHVTDPQRGVGVELVLEPLPTKTVWLIESALAAETKVRAATGGDTPARPPTEPPEAVVRGDVAEAETDLVRALEAEAESLRRLNPFLVLGVGYETTDGDVRAAFGELTKRYHPDRFARYQSTQLRQTAAEIFILIRDAYRKLADEQSRAQVLTTLKPASAPKRPQTQPSAQTSQPLGRSKTPPPMPRISVPAAIPPKIPAPPVLPASMPPPPAAAISPHDTPTNPSAAVAHELPTNPSAKTAQLAQTELAKGDHLAVPVAPPAAPPQQQRRTTGGIQRIDDHKSRPIRTPAAVTTPLPTSQAKVDNDNVADADALIDQGRLDDALAAFRTASKKNPSDRALRAGVELVEGLKALVARDRMEAAQRFEAALEHDPSNERAARELAEMRRQATNERKGLLSRLMGKKEPT